MKAIRGGLLLAVGMGAAIVVMPGTSSAEYPGANGRIAYSGHLGTSRPDIFTVLPSGLGTEQLTDDDVGDFQPSWSASGHRIVYVHGRYRLLTIGAHGGNPSLVIRDNRIVGLPHFAPNGRRIVYHRVKSEGAIYTIRTDGTNRRRVTAGNWPSYSPNGQRIVFSGTPDGKSTGGVWTIDPDGTHLRRVTRDGRDAYDQMPEWSPDGDRILFVRCDNDSQHECQGALDLVNADGSHIHRISDWEGDYSPPTFSPSGKLIARVRLESQSYDAVFCADVYAIKLTGSETPVTHNCADHDSGGPRVFAEQPSWQPLP